MDVSLSGGTTGTGTSNLTAGHHVVDISTACLSGGAHFEMSCSGGVWSLQITAECFSGTITGGTLLSCDPKLHVRFVWASACCSAIPITVDFLEP